MKKGSYVTKSIYQKLAEQNKKLILDISILVSESRDLIPDRIFIMSKWRKKFKDEKLFINMLKDYCKKHSLKK